MNKKIFVFLFSIILLTIAISSVDAALCKGYDGYYHDCGYSYGHNSYRGYDDYSRGGYGQNVVYLNNYKKYNPINEYYIYSGPGYQRTYNDRDWNYDRHDDRHGKRNVRYIRDERTFEHRYNVNPGGRQLRVYIDGASVYGNSVFYDKKSNTAHVIRLGSNYNDGDPYHDVRSNWNRRTLKLTGEEHCPDGFDCISSQWV